MPNMIQNKLILGMLMQHKPIMRDRLLVSDMRMSPRSGGCGLSFRRMIE